MAPMEVTLTECNFINFISSSCVRVLCRIIMSTVPLIVDTNKNMLDSTLSYFLINTLERVERKGITRSGVYVQVDLLSLLCITRKITSSCCHLCYVYHITLFCEDLRSHTCATEIVSYSFTFSLTMAKY